MFVCVMRVGKSTVRTYAESLQGPVCVSVCQLYLLVTGLSKLQN